MDTTTKPSEHAQPPKAPVKGASSSKAAGFTELTWDGTNAEAMAAFTDSRSEVRPVRDGIPNVLVLHGRRGVAPLEEPPVTASSPREPVKDLRPRGPDRRFAAEHIVTAAAPREAVDEALSVRIGDTVMKSPNGALFVRRPDGRFEGDQQGFLKELLKEEPKTQQTREQAAREQAARDKEARDKAEREREKP
jgi:hypothetical protein